MNGWWDLEPLEQNSLLSLNSDVLGPLDEASEISFWLDVSSDSEIAWILCEKRILFFFAAALGTAA